MMKKSLKESLHLKNTPIYIFLLIWAITPFVLRPAQAFEKQTELKIPAAVNPGLKHLLDLADPDKNVTFNPQKIAAVLDFVESPKEDKTIYYSNILQGLTSAYYDFDIHKNFKTLVDYAFNPDIPGVAVTPSSMRIFKWLDSQGTQQTYPRVGQYLKKLSSPVLFRGHQFVENTPDLTSGAYYGYNVHQILLLFKFQRRNILVTVSRQADISTVGKKGYVLGSDTDWDYLYSGKPGLTVRALGWVRSYMYNSAGINIYEVIDPAAPKVRCATFKWLRAGWSGINMVQKKHIHRGLIRFAETYKKILESPSLPPLEKLTADFSQIKILSPDVLRSKMLMYSKILKSRYNSGRPRSGKWPADIFEKNHHWTEMSPDEMQSVLVIEYMKHALGKTRPDEVRELLGLKQ